MQRVMQQLPNSSDQTTNIDLASQYHSGYQQAQGLCVREARRKQGLHLSYRAWDQFQQATISEAQVSCCTTRPS